MQNTFPIAIVVSEFNKPITQALLDGAHGHLLEMGFNPEQIKTVWVPGAIEIPLTVQRLAKTGSYEAIITLGAVIQGETKHFDYVCQQVSHGCQQLALEYDIPVIFGVLTTDNIAQAQARAGGIKGHKGKEAAQAAIAMVEVLRSID